MMIGPRFLAVITLLLLPISWQGTLDTRADNGPGAPKVQEDKIKSKKVTGVPPVPQGEACDPVKTVPEHLLETPVQAVTRLAQDTVKALTPLENREIQCPDYVFEKSPYGFSSLNPSPRVFEDFLLPRDYRTLYRSDLKDTSHYGITLAVSAMLGEPSAHVGSHQYSDLKKILQGESQLDQSPYLAEYQGGGIEAVLRSLAQCGPFSPRGASELAADLMDKKWRKRSPTVVQQTYLDQSSVDRFLEYPKDASYSSVYQKVSAQYGGKTLAIQERAPRSIDKGYWEFAKKGKAFSAQHLWDNGEYLTPGYFHASDIAGLWLRKTDGARFNGQLMKEVPPLDWVFQKVRVKDRDYVLLIDGSNYTCLEESPEHHFFACDFNYPESDKSGLKPFPKIDVNQEAPVSAVIDLCQPGKSCPPPTEVFKEYKSHSSRPIPREILEQVRLSTTRMGVSAIFMPQSERPVYTPQSIRVLSAKVRTEPSSITVGNVTDKAAAFSNGKTAITYKVSAKFLGDPAPGQAKDFEIKWSCGSSEEVHRVYRLPMEAENSKFEIRCPESQNIVVKEATYGKNLILLPGEREDTTLAEKVRRLCEGNVSCKAPIQGVQGKRVVVAYSCNVKDGEVLEATDQQQLLNCKDQLQ